VNLQETIRRILREKTKAPLYIRRRVSASDIERLVRDVKISISGGKNKSDALYDAVQNFISSNKEQFKDYMWSINHLPSLLTYINSRLDDEPLNESILMEETKLPNYLRRRIDIEILEEIYVYVLKVTSKRYTDNKKRLNAMTPYKFNQMVTSDLIEEVAQSFELELLDGDERFEQLWDFLNDRYSKRNIKQFYEIR